MNIDRRLDLGSALTQRSLSQSPQEDEAHDTPSHSSSDTDQQAFSQALKEQTPNPVEESNRSLSPFALFAASRVSSSASNPEPEVNALAHTLRDSVSQLLVSDGHKGHRREVRLELKDDLLPGVMLLVFENEGRTATSFICANENSREKLMNCASKFAIELAHSLNRPVQVRVQTDDVQDPQLLEILAEPDHR